MARHAGLTELDDAAMSDGYSAATGLGRHLLRVEGGAAMPSRFAQRIDAMRARRSDDPEAAALERRRRAVAFVADCEARRAAGGQLSDAEAAMLKSHQQEAQP